MVQKKGKVLNQTSFYSADCLILIQQALEIVGNSTVEKKSAVARSRYASSSDEEAESDDSSRGQSDDSASDEEATKRESLNSQSQVGDNTAVSTHGTPPKRQVNLEKLQLRQSDIRVRKYVDALTCQNFELSNPVNSYLCLPVSILSKDDWLLAEHSPNALKLFEAVAKKLQADKPVVVLFVRSGRFAGAVFVRGECVTHHTKTTYTIRKGQGKAQSTQDSQRRAKSIGSQLRRQGEEKLQEDISECVLRWKSHIDDAALIMVSCPKTMKKYFFEALDGTLSREDERIRRVPLDLGRPTFENAVLIHDVLTTVTVREIVELGDREVDSLEQKAVQPSIKPGSSEASKIEKRNTNEQVNIPLSALHVACKNGDFEVIHDLLASSSNELTVMAGPDLMTPLHYAAGCSSVVEPSVAANCVTELLMQGRANPSLLDGRSRPPYFVATHDAVREAFRIARAHLGEDYCDWDASKVGPPLTAEDLQKKKDKEAEKRRKKKARQKQKKVQDKAAAEELELRRQEEEEKARQVAEAKRVRDGLQPKTNKASNVCDFCQKECKGRKRSQMFKRLDYAYCSTACVQDHKRELMAKAALSRFGS